MNAPTGQAANPLLDLVEQHGNSISSLNNDVRDISIDVLITRAIVYGLMANAKKQGIDLRPACIAMRDLLPEEHRAAFVDRLWSMYGIDLPI